MAQTKKDSVDENPLLRLDPRVVLQEGKEGNE